MEPHPPVVRKLDQTFCHCDALAKRGVLKPKGKEDISLCHDMGWVRPSKAISGPNFSQILTVGYDRTEISYSGLARLYGQSGQ